MSYAYDAKGQLVRVDDSATGYWARYYYDEVSRLTSYDEIGNGRSTHRVTYHYDNKGNPGTREEKIGNETRTTAIPIRLLPSEIIPTPEIIRLPTRMPTTITATF